MLLGGGSYVKVMLSSSMTTSVLYERMQWKTSEGTHLSAGMFRILIDAQWADTAQTGNNHTVSLRTTSRALIKTA